MINIVVFRASWRIDTNVFWLLISQFENLTRGQVKLLISWMTKVDHAAYQLLCHDKTNIMTSRARSNSIPPELLTYVFWPMRTSCDLYGTHWLAVAFDTLPNCIWIVTDCLFIIDVESKRKDSEQGTSALTGWWQDPESNVIALPLKFTEACHVQSLLREAEK